MSEHESSFPFRHIRRDKYRQFQELMRFRVRDILLVSSLYDSFILSQDGQLSEMILGEFLDLNLRHSPGLRQVSTGQEALELATEQRRFNLIITSLHLGDMTALELATGVRERGLDTPVVVLAYDHRAIEDFIARHDTSPIDRFFLWQGDVRILLSIVKYVEDKKNVAHDTGEIGVQAILLVEDSIRYYSSFLPLLYAELMKQAHSLISEGTNLTQKILRMRARPKVLLCSSYEEAWDTFERYEDDILGVISDVRYPRRGRKEGDAGVELARMVRSRRPDMPIMLQSSQERYRAVAEELGASFLRKGSPVLLQHLARFMTDNFGFGPFIFRTPDGREAARAADLRELEEALRYVPLESLLYHGERNHFSRWLKARTEFALAEDLGPKKITDFGPMEDLRKQLIRFIREYRLRRDRATVGDFDRHDFDTDSNLLRIGGGSLGGKARGLAFMNYLLNTYEASCAFEGVRIQVPPAVIVATDVFDAFLEENDLRDFAIESQDEDEILRRFLAAPLPERARADLAAYLQRVHYPIAVRSSSLLEDSQYKPLAGIYVTDMLPNNHAELDVRMAELVSAIKRVYASTFSRHAKSYLEATPYRVEEEKMAVIIQRITGSERNGRLYPDVSGVVRSHNYYPTGPMGPKDGVAAIALGLGKAVVEGEPCLRFSPRFPRHAFQYTDLDQLITGSQRTFYALDLSASATHRGDGSVEASVRRYGMAEAEADGALLYAGSTYSPENQAVYDGTSRKGLRLVTFAPILKHDLFPLAKILDFLLDVGKWGTGSDVEIEFAVNLSVPEGEPKELAFLQLRPQAAASDSALVTITDSDRERAFCRSESVLGNGVLEELRDVLVVDYDTFDRLKSHEAARELSTLARPLAADQVPFILIAVGRLGTADPLLGIPVSWDEIAGARVIVESGFRDFHVTPSQGTHFFQNLTAYNVGYFTVNEALGGGRVDWAWLKAQPALAGGSYVRHVRFSEPLTVKMDGRTREGVILPPG